MGCHQAHRRRSFVDDGGAWFRGHQLGDSEIQEFDGSIGTDENVAGFDVSMDNEVLVGVVQGVADLEEELEPLVGF